MGMMLVEWEERKENSEIVACDSLSLSRIPFAPSWDDEDVGRVAWLLLPSKEWWSPNGLSVIPGGSGSPLVLAVPEMERRLTMGLLSASNRRDCRLTGVASSSPSPGGPATGSFAPFSPLFPPILNSLSGLLGDLADPGDLAERG